jgi:hypothetical protein
MFGRHKDEIRLITAFAVVLLPFAFWFGYPFLTCWVFGGDALGGKVEDGHFYLGSHGRYTEVSRPGYIASAGGLAFWALSGLIVAIGAAMFGAGREWASASAGRKFGMILGLVVLLSAAALIAYLTFGAIAVALKA